MRVAFLRPNQDRREHRQGQDFHSTPVGHDVDRVIRQDREDSTGLPVQVDAPWFCSIAAPAPVEESEPSATNPGWRDSGIQVRTTRGLALL
jgi:hypothetical protein